MLVPHPALFITIPFAGEVKGISRPIGDAWTSSALLCVALLDWSPWPRGASSPLTPEADTGRRLGQRGSASAQGKRAKQRTNVSMSPRRDHVSRRPRRGAARHVPARAPATGHVMAVGGREP